MVEEANGGRHDATEMRDRQERQRKSDDGVDHRYYHSLLRLRSYVAVAYKYITYIIDIIYNCK